MMGLSRHHGSQKLLLQILSEQLLRGQRGFARVAPPLPVILQEEIPSLGPAGAQVAVAQGYAHNYLLPKKLAIYDLKAKFGYGGRSHRRKKEAEAKASSASTPEPQQQSLSSEQQELQRMVQRLLSQPVVVKRKFRTGQILEGQVTRGTVIDAIAKQHKIQMVPELVEMDAPILQHGIYDIPLGIIMPDGQQAILEVLVKLPRKVGRDRSKTTSPAES